MRKLKVFLAIFLLPLSLAVAQTTDAPIVRYDDLRHPVYGANGMVSSQNAHATEVGAQVLADGGNAVDAAVAVGFALAVTLPRAGNLGGGTGADGGRNRDGIRGPFPKLTKPIIGAVNGVAVTGGFELALNCDFLVASEHAKFGDTHTRVGVMPGWGLTVLLPQAIGVRRARDAGAQRPLLLLQLPPVLWLQGPVPVPPAAELPVPPRAVAAGPVLPFPV